MGPGPGVSSVLYLSFHCYKMGIMLLAFPDCKDEWDEACTALSTDHSTQSVLFPFPLPPPIFCCHKEAGVRRFLRSFEEYGLWQHFSWRRGSSLGPCAGSLLLALLGVIPALLSLSSFLQKAHCVDSIHGPPGPPASSPSSQRGVPAGGRGAGRRGVKSLWSVLFGILLAQLTGACYILGWRSVLLSGQLSLPSVWFQSPLLSFPPSGPGEGNKQLCSPVHRLLQCPIGFPSNTAYPCVNDLFTDFSGMVLGFDFGIDWPVWCGMRAELEEARRCGIAWPRRAPGSDSPSVAVALGPSEEKPPSWEFGEACQTGARRSGYVSILDFIS